MKNNKKAQMGVNNLFDLVLQLVLIGMILGVGLVVLGKFAVTSGITNDASTAINNTITALTPIASDWLPLIVTVTVLAIILIIVLRSFAIRTR